MRLQSTSAISTPGVAVEVDDKKVGGVEMAEVAAGTAASGKAEAEVAAEESATPTPTDADGGTETPKSQDTDGTLSLSLKKLNKK